MLVVFYFLSERVRVPVHEGQDGVVPLFIVNVQVVAPDAVAPLAGLVQSEAVAVEFQTFGFFTVAKHLLARVSFLGSCANS